uniref:Uncharacterized protein n=1 Tax=Solanum lycopersicum TaxID=4081 RepID=K4BQB2_SOLLC
MERCKHKVDKLIGKNMFSGSLEPFGMLQPVMKAYSFSPPYYSNKNLFFMSSFRLIWCRMHKQSREEQVSDTKSPRNIASRKKCPRKCSSKKKGLWLSRR